ncbi:MAG: M20/M25/M40 family metallo-hydrolase [Gemmatimonadetes bacterium]|nr:M20/M25/M40 family metallo-hydrolase [Gemmatimonadota bacterium]
MKRFAAAIALLVVALVGVMVARTLRVSAPPAATAAPSAALPPLDTTALALHLAEAVRFPTVSLASGGPIDTAAFRGLHDYLQSTYPLVHTTLSREVVGGLSLLYTWRGRDTTLAPIVIMGHFDVVPVTESNLAEWLHPPFAGEIADGYVWGRGTLDDKATVVAALEAVEGLLRAGVVPARTIYLTFGHDEEVGGRYGARTIVNELVARGVAPALVIDEGGFMGKDILPGIEGIAAIVGIAEKGYVSLTLTAEADGGHSSMPTERTAIGALSRAVARLEADPFPASLDGPTATMIQAMAPYQPFLQRVISSNLWITSGVVSRALQADELGGALLRTTTAPTMLSAGIKDNVLPPEATAGVNFRIRPGETVASVMARVTEVVDDPRVRVAPLDSVGVDPSPVSDTSDPAYKLIASTIAAMSPGTTVPVIPYLVMGGTDAKYWGPHSARVYRFLPIPLGDGDRARVHGVNERVAVGDFATAVGFFMRLLQGDAAL